MLDLSELSACLKAVLIAIYSLAAAAKHELLKRWNLFPAAGE
jgi:hypothetical protein